MKLEKERVMLGALALVLAMLSVGRDLPDWSRWACLGIGLVLLVSIARGTSATRLRALQNERDEMERYFRALMDSVPASIYFKDRESRFLQVNHAIATALGAAFRTGNVGKNG